MADNEPADDEPSWSVEFGLKLEGDSDLAEVPEQAFTARIARDAAVRRVTDWSTTSWWSSSGVGDRLA